MVGHTTMMYGTDAVTKSLFATYVVMYTIKHETRYRPGGGETICPRRWQFDSRRIYVRPRTGPQSAHLWWPAVAKLQAASVPIAKAGTDRRTDRDGSQYRLMPLPPTAGGIMKTSMVSGYYCRLITTSIVTILPSLPT